MPRMTDQTGGNNQLSIGYLLDELSRPIYDEAGPEPLGVQVSVHAPEPCNDPALLEQGWSAKAKPATAPAARRCGASRLRLNKERAVADGLCQIPCTPIQARPIC